MSSLYAILAIFMFAVTTEGFRPSYSPEQIEELEARHELVAEMEETHGAHDGILKFRQVSKPKDEDEETQEELIADVMPKKASDGPATAYHPQDEELKRLEGGLQFFKDRTGVDLTGAPMLIEKVVHPALDMAKQAARATSGFVEITEHGDEKDE